MIETWKKQLKWIGIIFGITFVIGLFGIFILAVIAVIATTSSKSTGSTEVKESEIVQPTTVSSPEQDLETEIRSSVASNTIKDIKITKQVNGGYSILVMTNELPAFSDDSTKKGIWMDMTYIYTAIYKEPREINQAAIVAYMDLVDKYGKTSSEVVMKTSLDKDEAKKVNWDESQSTLSQLILPKVWTVDEVNPSLR